MEWKNESDFIVISDRETGKELLVARGWIATILMSFLTMMFLVGVLALGTMAVFMFKVMVAVARVVM